MRKALAGRCGSARFPATASVCCRCEGRRALEAEHNSGSDSRMAIRTRLARLCNEVGRNCQ
jgi:hypothetical protein